ncbi:hypothetical protein O1611_g6907 [Lasiodiplodia mahajangana]|uniref:Uncharacterized protein n=1 Tax=Lasiodiplodia mahajangana TaxID=1108764 RepID=A0ACC2JH19_9PEZI|nr:hypothetical protein O1611_g6907 [Lasiodiplodia mahajangana]
MYNYVRFYVELISQDLEAGGQVFGELTHFKDDLGELNIISRFKEWVLTAFEDESNILAPMLFAIKETYNLQQHSNTNSRTQIVDTAPEPQGQQDDLGNGQRLEATVTDNPILDDAPVFAPLLSQLVYRLDDSIMDFKPTPKDHAAMLGSGKMTLAAHLLTLAQSTGRHELCTSVLSNLIPCIESIGHELSVSQHVARVGAVNTFGDEQLNVDILAEQAIRRCIAKCPSVLAASSEEDPKEQPVQQLDPSQKSTNATAEQYTLAFDPLDGSSIIAANWTVGTIIGIWDGPSALDRSPKVNQIAAVLGIYGPRTTAIVAVRLPGFDPICFEVGLGRVMESDGTTKFLSEMIRTEVKLLFPPFTTRYFAPANLRAAAEDEKYMRLITSFIQKKYTLRYSGGLVPDIYHMLVKGHGVYISPVTSASKAKLRRLYELLPIALIIECCGGRAVDPTTGVDILDNAVKHCDERAGLLCGSKEEVDEVVNAMINSS